MFNHVATCLQACKGHICTHCANTLLYRAAGECATGASAVQQQSRSVARCLFSAFNVWHNAVGSLLFCASSTRCAHIHFARRAARPSTARVLHAQHGMLGTTFNKVDLWKSDSYCEAYSDRRDSIRPPAGTLCCSQLGDRLLPATRVSGGSRDPGASSIGHAAWDADNGNRCARYGS